MNAIASPKYGLALHTTTGQLGLAISNFNGDSRDRVWDLDRELSNHLHEYLQEFIKPQTWQDLAFVAVAKGPGGFTGTRIGVVTARTIAQQLKIPLFGISTLAAIARAFKDRYPRDRALVVQMDARREEIYIGIYQENNGNWQVKLGDTTVTPTALETILKNLDNDYEIIPSPTHIGSTVKEILELAYLEWQQGKHPSWQEVLPFYGQKPI
jgi:tRNA threonylcarbamoyl adenosine modification protein YeaZ